LQISSERPPVRHRIVVIVVLHRYYRREDSIRSKIRSKIESKIVGKSGKGSEEKLWK